MRLEATAKPVKQFSFRLEKEVTARLANLLRQKGCWQGKRKAAGCLIPSPSSFHVRKAQNPSISQSIGDCAMKLKDKITKLQIRPYLKNSIDKLILIS